jgi:hypothetical protein
MACDVERVALRADAKNNGAERGLSGNALNGS